MQTGVAESRDHEVLELRRRVAELERRLEKLVDAEEQVLGARAQAQALLDNIPHMAWMKDIDGTFLAINEAFARACGLEKRQILGKTDRDIWPLEHAERYMRDDQRVIESGEKFFADEPIAESGDTKWFETFKTPVSDARGSIIGTVGLARDITERKRVEAQRLLLERRMQETQKLESLGVLAGGIAHDFNNLLVGVLSNAELALVAAQHEHAGSDLRERLSDVRNAALHAAELTNQMLAYSGRGHFDVRPISLSDVLCDMGHLLVASISKKAHVKYELSDDLPAVQADIAQIRQVIMNLIINASDALEDHTGTILVRTGVEQVGEQIVDLQGPAALVPGQYVFLEVTDDGCGMDADTRARLFEPFFTTKFTGRGLGLSAVQGIVRGHGGGIVLRTSLGAGTLLKVLLPCSAEPATSVDRREPRTASEWHGHGLVMLVDDDARVRTVTALLLRDIGFEVLAMATGRDAVREFERRAEEVKVVVLDVTMPDLSGDQVLRELRRRRADVPVLLCSGYSEDEMRDRFSERDLACFLQKPYAFDSFRARLRELSEPSTPKSSRPPPAAS
jgi:PAS domain S-box-containing protein